MFLAGEKFAKSLSLLDVLFAKQIIFSLCKERASAAREKDFNRFNNGK